MTPAPGTRSAPGMAAIGIGLLLGLVALAVLVVFRGSFHIVDLVVVAATASSAFLVRHLGETKEESGTEGGPASPDERTLAEAASKLRDVLSRSIDARMDAAICVAKIAADSPSEGARLAALAEELRGKAEAVRADLDSIHRIINYGIPPSASNGG